MVETTLGTNQDQKSLSDEPVKPAVAPSTLSSPSDEQTEPKQAPAKQVTCDVTVATDVIRCAQCSEQIDVLAPGSRCRSKVKQQFACGKCASVDSRLRRLLGTWPLDEMRDCSEQDTFEFYRRAAATAGSSELKVQVKHVLKQAIIKRKVNRNLGEWLPIGVWEARGWATDVIERHESKVDSKKESCIETESSKTSMTRSMRLLSSAFVT